MQTTRIMIVLLAAAGMATAGSLAYAQNSQPTVQAPVQQAVAPAAAAEAVPAAVAQPAPIGIEQAIAAAQKHHPGSKVKDIELKGKHGIMVYDIELVSGWKEYDVKVDAATGKVISSRFDGLSVFH
jgi:uncharacterized membrane protein YkoI